MKRLFLLMMLLVCPALLQAQVDQIRVKRMFASESPWVDVTSPVYGALADDDVDDTAAFKVAIAAAEAGTSSNIIKIPKGTYVLSSTINIADDYITLEGSGWDTVLAFTSALGATPAIKFDKSGAVLINGNRVKNLRITLAAKDSIGIWLQDPTNTVIDSVQITGQNAVDTTSTGIYADGSTLWGGGVNIHDSLIEYNKFGIHFAKVIAASVIRDNWITGLSTAPSGCRGFIQDETTDSGNWLIANNFEGWDVAIFDKGINLTLQGNRFEQNTIDINHDYPDGQRWVDIGNMTSADKVTATKTTGFELNYNRPVIFGGHSDTGSSNVYGAGIHDATIGLYVTAASASPIFNIKSQNGGTGLFNEDLEGVSTTGIASVYDLNIGTSHTSDLAFYTDSVKRMELGSGGSLLYQSDAPTFTILDTSGTVDAGAKWRFISDGDKFDLQMNTSADGSFTTNKRFVRANQYGIVMSSNDAAVVTQPSINTPFIISNYNPNLTSSYATGLYAASYGHVGVTDVRGLIAFGKPQPTTDGVGAYTTVEGIRSYAYSYGSSPNYLGPASIAQMRGVYTFVSAYPNADMPLAVTDLIGVEAKIGTYRSDTTITNSYNFLANRTTNGSGTNSTTTNDYGYYYKDWPDANRTITNQFGIFVEKPTRGSTINVGIWNEGTLRQVEWAYFDNHIKTATYVETPDVKVINDTSGSVEIKTVAGALGTQTFSLPADTGTACVIKNPTALTEATDIVAFDFSAQSTACSPSWTFAPAGGDGFTLGEITNCAAAKRGLIVITNGAIGAETLTYNGTYWTIPEVLDTGELSPGADEITFIGFVCTSATHARVVSVIRDTEPTP
jgi:hypothetical protein